MLSRFHLIPERYGQTDGRNCYINIARQCADAQQKPELNKLVINFVGRLMFEALVK